MKIIPKTEELMKLRITKGYGIETLAEKAGVAIDTIRRVEKGCSPRPSVAKKIHEALETEFETIFTIE